MLMVLSTKFNFETNIFKFMRQCFSWKTNVLGRLDDFNYNRKFSYLITFIEYMELVITYFFTPVREFMMILT